MYFVTLVTQDRACLFGEVINGEMYLNALGQIVQEEWMRSPRIRSELDLDRWIVMPNHLHGIVHFTPWRADGRADAVRPYNGPEFHGCCRGARPRALPVPLGMEKRSLGSFIGGFKSITTKRINEIRKTPGMPVWQRNYDEHIIDNDQELERVRQYIKDNPHNWHEG
jgi:putative transposase